ncbi:MAG: hypothetical protein ACQEVA_00145 [Myxococcota bacterium]
MPALYISKIHTNRLSNPTDGITVDALNDLADKLAEAGVHSPAASGLIAGSLIQTLDEPHVLLCLGDASRDLLAQWFRVAWSTYTSIVCCASSDFGDANHIGPDDMPLVTGHGAVLASRGVTGEPLAGMRVGQLRRELEESRRVLSEAAGYEVRLLVPTPTTFGKAVDGLVIEEARRAGYRRVLHPGGGLLDLDDDPIADQTNGCARLPYRTVDTDDTPLALARWVVGDRFTRPAARLKQLVRTPRRLLDRLKKG